jgi:ABC-2 type transport system permease protein
MTAIAKAGGERGRTSRAFATPARRVGSHRRPEPTGIQQWLALTRRMVVSMAKNGALLVALIAPLVFTLGFYLPLKFVMQVQGIDYAQFLMPIIVLQAMAFTAISAAQLSAIEAVTGLNDRLHTMPVAALAPLASRMTGGLVRSIVSLAAALAYGYAIGFRFTAGPWQALWFCLLSLAVSTALALGADAIGTLSKSPEATSQALTLPMLIFGMLSCGFVPETGFPEWVRPFVRNQPISQFSFAMRDMAAGGVQPSTLWPALAWIIGLSLAFIPLAVWASVRRK